MDSQCMIPTLILPKILHLEPTDSCQAACPQCAREVDVKFDKNNLHHLTVNQIKELVSEDTIKNLDKMYMCGDYGDPAAGKHTLEIYEYFKFINPNITLGMNSNGGIRSTDWWRKLANVMTKKQDYVVFSIDGLENTNHIYRINVNWNKVIENAKAFISEGGNAHWDMLVFEHNEHQVKDCQVLAQKLGFKWFRAKVSNRHNEYPINFLKSPKEFTYSQIKEGKITCQALKEESIYISSRGIVYPCCWLGPTNNTIENFNKIKQSWNSDTPNKICKTFCTEKNSYTNFTNQWQREVEF